MSTLADRLEALATMSPAQLRAEWGRLCASPLPRLSPEIIRLALAYRVQEQALGGLSIAARRQLQRKAEGKSKEAPRLKPGTRLLRSWHGRSVAVTVTEQGFSFAGRNYASLSSIAREVTGAHWSGPRFFGLTAAGGRSGG